MAKIIRERDISYTEESPFIVRRPLVRLWQMIFFGLLMTLTIYASIYYGSEDFRNFVVLLFGILIIILLYFIQNTYFDEKTATEFQCSVYAGAMRSNTMLSFILTQSCNIYYLDQRYLTAFGKSSHMQTLDSVMDSLDLSDKQREKIIDCIRSLKFHEFQHKAFDGFSRNTLMIGIYPIHRPVGYVYFSIYKIKED